MQYEMTPHQSASVYYCTRRPDVPYVFLIGGFGAGKSMTDVFLLLSLISLYRDYPGGFNVGLIGVTIKLLTQTVLKDLKLALDAGGISYRDNAQTGTMKVGSVTIIYLAMSDPADIFAHNFNCAIVDELDELPPSRVADVVKAVQERNRIPCPAPLSRDPFIFFSTTAQGLGGTYMFTQQLKKQGVRHVVIHARTADNPFIAKSQLALLAALYTEDERKAFLEGKFVNLAQGKVYPDFVRRRNVYMRFPVEPSDCIFYGHDFNTAFNCTVDAIYREGRIYVIDARHYDVAGDSFGAHRRAYPANHIVCIPDASGKNILTGFQKEAEDSLVDIQLSSKNPSIAERIWAVNLLFRQGRLFLFSPTKDPKEMLEHTALGLEVRAVDPKTGKPEKGEGITAVDHFCDSLEYAVWHIIHKYEAFDDILDAIRYRFHRSEERGKEAA